MRKLIGAVTLSAVLCTFAGCSEKKAETPIQDNKTVATQNDNRRGEFARPDLSGEVESIADKEITLNVFKQPEKPPEGQGRRQRDEQQGEQKGEQKEQQPPQQQEPKGDQSVKKEGEQKSPQNGEPRERAREFTGEKKKITIPAGISVTTMVRTDKGRETKEIDVKEIKAGDTLQIWYSDKQAQTISRISLMPKRTN